MTFGITHAWRRSYAVLFLGTLGVVASADVLLYSHRLGWNAALVAAVMLAVLAVRDTTFLAHAGGRIAWAASAGLLLALFEQPTWLNIAFMLLCLSALALINRHGWEGDVRWVGRFVRWIATGWTRLFLDNGVAVRWLSRRGFSPTLARGTAAWIIPLLFTSVFIAIFAWANPIISDWLGRLGTMLSDVIATLPALLNIGRLIFWLVFAAFAWSLMRNRTARLRKSGDGMTAAECDEWMMAIRETREQNAIGIPAAMVIRCLILFNLVFLVENTLDARFLWRASLPPGFSYTQYVHRGAYPLVWAALLAGAFVLVTFNPRSATERSPWARRLVYCWIAQTIFLTLSAAWRLVRYIEMDQLTRLRLASTIWFMLVALGLFYIVWRIVRGRSNAWLINVNVVTALLALYPCCFLNSDGMIADFNVSRCAEAGGTASPLDVEYFQTLGTPALPALDGIREKIIDPVRHARARSISRTLHGNLALDLRDWRSWTWRRARIARAAKESSDLYEPTNVAAATAAAARPIAPARSGWPPG